MLRSYFIFLLILTCSCTSGRSVAPGNLAPQFSLPTLNGDIIDSSSFAGKVVLLNFWASWCGPCIAEMPALEQLYSRYKNKGFVVVAIGINDELDALKKFSDRLGLSFPVLFDKDGTTREQYSISGVPESFFIDKQGHFLLITDPQDRSPTVRIIGPRSWDSPSVAAMIERMLDS